MSGAMELIGRLRQTIRAVPNAAASTVCIALQALLADAHVQTRADDELLIQALRERIAQARASRNGSSRLVL
jgi:hypothetical protein